MVYHARLWLRAYCIRFRVNEGVDSVDMLTSEIRGAWLTERYYRSRFYLDVSV
jgi:hypothetical protein